MTSKITNFIEDFKSKYHQKFITDIILPQQKQEALVDNFYAEFDKALEVRIDQKR